MNEDFFFSHLQQMRRMNPYGHLPRQCRCGDTFARSCPGKGLYNHRNFPPFACLPDMDSIDEDYYSYDSTSFMYVPSRHWVLVGEIVEDLSDFIRHRVLLETLYGEEVQVNFHLEDFPCPIFPWFSVQPGNTMMILYAQSKVFLDMNHGVRLESSTSVMVFPTNVGNVNEAMLSLSNSKSAATRSCFQCSAKTATNGEKLKQCAQCHVALYCSRECQVKNWAKCHRKLCSSMPQLKVIADLDFANFVDFASFDL